MRDEESRLVDVVFFVFPGSLCVGLRHVDSMMIQIVNANALTIPLADESVQCTVTSPPYWGLRDYGVAGQLGNEEIADCLGWATGTMCEECFVCHMRQVFREVWRVTKSDGVLWLNLGDCYITTPPGKNKGQSKSDVDGAYQRRQMRQLGNGEDATAIYSKSKRGVKRWGGGNLKPKDLVGTPWRVAFALQADGWYLRSDVIWEKPNPMPESVTDRPTRSHEYIFLLSKSKRYFYDGDAIREPYSDASLVRISEPNFDNQTGGEKDPINGGEGSRHRSARQGLVGLKNKIKKQDEMGRTYAGFNDRYTDQPELGRNKRDVWTIATLPYPGSHFATFPPALVEPCVLAGSRVGDIVLDPFAGTATVGQVCAAKQRHFVGLELNKKYLPLAKARTTDVQIEMMELT